MLTPEFTAAAWRTMVLNLEAASLEPWRALRDGAWTTRWRDSYDLTRMLLLPKLVRGCEVKGQPLLFAPTVSRVYLAGSEDPQAIAAVLDDIDAHLSSEDSVSPYQFRELLFGWPWTERNGELVKAELPPKFASRIDALDALLAKRRGSSTKHVEGFAAAAYAQPGAPKPGVS